MIQLHVWSAYMCVWLHVWLATCVVSYMCGRLHVWLRSSYLACMDEEFGDGDGTEWTMQIDRDKKITHTSIR